MSRETDSRFVLPKNYTGELTAFTPTIGSQLDELMRELDSDYGDRQTNARDIQEGSSADTFHWIVATDDDGQIVGSANLSVLPYSLHPSTFEVEPTPTLWLGSFVVSDRARGTGVAANIWEEMGCFGEAHAVNRIQFMTEPARPAAIRFYEKMGAQALGGPRLASLFDVYIPNNPIDHAASQNHEKAPTPPVMPIYERYLGNIGLVLVGANQPVTFNHVDLENAALALGLQRIQIIAAPTATDDAKATLASFYPLSPSREIIMSHDWKDAL